MADKPSRALVLFGDGLARSIDPSHTHLHALAFKALCGFLSLPNSPPSESDDERIVREFAVLLDGCETYLNTGGQMTDDDSQKILINQTLPDRFMGMKAAILTNNTSLKSFSAKLGLSVLQLDELGKVSIHEVNVVVLELLKLLGFQEGKVQENNQFDIVFFHIGAGEKVNGNEQKVMAADLEYINALVGGVMCQTQPESDISFRLHLSLVMSYGNILADDNSKFSVLKSFDAKNPNLPDLFPCQSYTMKGEIPRKDVRHHCPMLIAQYQDGVTRKDCAERFSFKDFKEYGGNLVIPADRFLHEIAFKLWRAPKYGA
ncbi:hypothetical protein L6164_024509 [Bauhinia variegata]|uniref:Uncharacterized protein n=1 Tax=Bauhinia variegata TaxID=167791 RepID=A0ACB9LZ56_BAUVA|nr:hypothetical protein L6164_024509 [Bauhinia variegata]